MKSVNLRIAEELLVKENQVEAAVQLLDEGATVPFIARYRKEITGGLDDTQLRTLEERLHYLREMDERREVIIKSIAEQGKLTPELEAELLAADTKTRLEDLYLPYKPKRRTKAQIAREAGLEPLAHALKTDPTLVPLEAATTYIDPEKNVPDAAAALEGARFILMEEFAETADLIGRLREYLWNEGKLVSTVIAGKEEEGAKFADYFTFSQPIKEIPSHRALALFRGREEGILQLSLTLDEAPDSETKNPFNVCEKIIADYFHIYDAGRPADAWLLETVRWAWQIRIFNHLDVDLKLQLWKLAEEEAIRVFALNIRNLLLAPPAGPRATMGLDPGLRTGVKVAVVDSTGKLLETGAIFPHPPRDEWKESIATLAKLAQRHQIELISIGNGTASRETDRLVKELIQQHPELNLTRVMVSEAGASVYSASELAAKEFPDLDVSYRGAVSIARRVQDPLAELVKIEPKAIGVGQYQHDVNQTQLARTLDAVVEDCVNAVGVDVNTASVPLLTRVSGLNRGIAEQIVNFRNQNGAFSSRKQLKNVPRLGEKTFEQSAGFLRIMKGENPLDASAVHPEAYPVVERILAHTQSSIQSLIGNTALLKTLPPEKFTDERFGLPTVQDILTELEKPGRDPRPVFQTAAFLEGVETLEDLRPGMVLEGMITNVTNFGAFVDIGVHQDGLVHISALSHKFVKDPHTVVKTGDIVKVKVLEVDLKRKRIALTMRLEELPGAKTSSGKFDSASQGTAVSKSSHKREERKPPIQSTLADALAQALQKGRKR